MSEREGECARCGECCAFPLVTIELTEDLAAFYSYFGIEVVKVGDRFRGRFRLGTVCRHFSRTDEGKGRCGIHEQRPHICRDYPLEKNKLHATCGYNFNSEGEKV